eukprot:scaffold9689_cov79-Skeletonema_dohrnii-CCMP3373.AAC.6
MGRGVTLADPSAATKPEACRCRVTAAPQEIAGNQEGGSDMKTESEKSTESHVLCLSFNRKWRQLAIP